jgi:hypothetical protein
MSDEPSNTTETAKPVIRPAVHLLRPERRGRDAVVRYLLDHRLFGLLVSPGQEEAIERFRASLACAGLAPDGGFPPLELSPLGFLEAVGIDPPQYDPLPLPPKLLKSGEHPMAATVIVKLIGEKFREAPEIRPEPLQKRVEEMRQATEPAAHELFDLCMTRWVSTPGFEEKIYNHLAFDYLCRYQFPEVLREEMFEFLSASLFAAGESMAGLSKMRMVKMLWDRAYERLLRGNPGARGDIQALDREMRLRNRKDFLDWEVIHYAILGHGAAKERVDPVTAFTLGSEEKIRARCIAYKTALRAFLDQISRDDLIRMRPQLTAWKPGAIAACREDGGFEALITTGDLPVFTGKAAN